MPTNRQRLTLILAQPWSFVISIYCFIVGLAVLASPIFHSDNPFSRVQTLPLGLNIAWGVALLVGGAMMNLAVLWSGKGQIGRVIERSSLYLVGSTFLTYGLVLASVTGWKALLPSLLSLLLVLGAVLRHLALKRIEAAVATIVSDSRS